ncbi:helix-turn-helix transcriptional regulator [Serratia fonticola]|jgi:DNA-binding NarL/FixJ family response regulator|uniref:Transcriptional regulatory protein uhpA n=1 Tax=Serratia fonticola TaxID=47917 RepID=A0A3S4XKY9_SERFO|nr:LuxR family transcriptional regulator [Serratia fonticola]CAI1616822.1 Transcriptional regulatory protein uhpA [Serratia fonticola]VEI75500.1 Transcriptional regulatory protein uhpA [Serratia fonticola]
MIPTLTIMISDTNRYFAKGLEAVLRQYFTNQGLTPRFFINDHRGYSADLIFQNVDTQHGAQFCQNHHTLAKSKVIAIQDTANTCHRQRMLPACLYIQGMIHRDIDCEEMLLEVERVWRFGAQTSDRPDCPCCGKALTLREKQVLSTIQHGMCLSQVARFLSLSPKTISAHKRNAMGKLGLQRNSELFYWLRNGGLNNQEETFS